MHSKNPLQVQFVSHNQRTRPTPLVLIHDGGGTTFNYFILGNLHRDVWAIHNPHFLTGERWDGGIDEMAHYYIGLLQKAGITGNILLGGWSLGGYLSLTIAHLLASKPSSTIYVVGLLLIDSPYHIPTYRLEPAYSEPVVGGLPVLVRKSFDNCKELLREWELPRWDGPACRGRDVTFTVSEKKFALRTGQVFYKPLQGDGYDIDKPPSLRATLSPKCIKPPPAVMVRCVHRAPAEDGSDEPCRVDLFRDEPLLGWDGNYPDFIKAVFETDSHHYDAFEFAKITQTTAILNQGLEVLESLEVSVE